jgi:AcrR family transcriptional regulator
VRAEMAATAMELFLAQGFDQTTIDQLAAVAGISRRSFFRYFPTKEDVVLGFMGDIGESLIAALAARPPGEAVWESLRRACDPALARYAGEPERVLALHSLFERTPSLRAREAEKHLRWQAGLTAELARRLRVDPADDLRPAVLAGATMAALKAAIDAWAAHPERGTPASALDAAFAALTVA